MKRTYSFLVTDEHIPASPYVRRFDFLHDLTLQQDQEEEINFLLQEPLTPSQRKMLEVSYDSHALSVKQVKVIPFTHQTLITATIKPHTSGAVRVTFNYPDQVTKRLAPKLSVRHPLTSAMGSPFSVLRPRK